jgi:hypothetical protein
MHTKISSVNLNRKGYLVDLDVVQIVQSKTEQGSKEKNIIGLSSLRCLVILGRRAREEAEQEVKKKEIEREIIAVAKKLK